MATSIRSWRRSALLALAIGAVVGVGAAMWMRWHEADRADTHAVPASGEASPSLATASGAPSQATSSRNPDAETSAEPALIPSSEHGVKATLGYERIADSDRVILVGRILGIDCLWPPRGISFNVRWNDGRTVTSLEKSEEPGSWLALVQPGTVSIDVFSHVGSFPDQELARVDVVCHDGPPPYPVPDEARGWRMPFAASLLTIDLSTNFNVERITLTPQTGYACEGLVGMLEDPETGRPLRIEPSDLNTLTIITAAADELRNVTIQACGMADTEHVWFAEPGCRDVEFPLTAAQEATLRVPPPPWSDDPAIAFGVMLCRKSEELSEPQPIPMQRFVTKWNPLTTDGTDRRGDLRNYAFFPEPGGEVVVALPVGDGSVGVCGVVGEVRESGWIQVTWRSKEAAPILVEPGSPAVVECGDDLWDGWDE